MPYLEDPGTLFIISSDFCHWGRRFDFQFTMPDKPIWQAITELDHIGMAVLEQGDPQAWLQYLDAYENTVCGRDPLFLLLHVRCFDSSYPHLVPVCACARI